MQSGIAHLIKQLIAVPLIFQHQECCNHHAKLKNLLIPENKAGFDCYDREQYFEYRGLCDEENQHSIIPWYTRPLFPEILPNHGVPDGKFSDKRYFTCEPNSRTVSVALDRLKPWTDSDIRDRHKDVRRHFLRILKRSQPAGEEK